MTINPLYSTKAVFVKKSNSNPDFDKKKITRSKTMVEGAKPFEKNKKSNEELSFSTDEDMNYTLTKIKNINQEDFKKEDIKIMNANSKLNSYRNNVTSCALYIMILSLITLTLLIIEVFFLISADRMN